MAASKEDIRDWFRRGASEGATHMLVVCDVYDHTDYPVFVGGGNDPRETARKCTGDMRRVMECYAMHLDMEAQLSEHRADHYEAVSARSALTPPAPPPVNELSTEAMGEAVREEHRCPAPDHVGEETEAAPEAMSLRRPRQDAPRNCSTCRHWGEPHIAFAVLGPEVDTGLRKCGAVPFYGEEDKGLPENPAALAYAHDGEGYLGELLTRASFGCVLHEPTERA